MADNDEEHDELPDELVPSAFVGPYTFPNNNRRRVPGHPVNNASSNIVRLQTTCARAVHKLIRQVGKLLDLLLPLGFE